MCSTVGGAQYRGGYHEYRGDILSTVGVFSTMGDILSTVGVFSTVGGYHDARGGYHTVGGKIFCYLSTPRY